jgi:photosystem II stability/assembly factor-like uncharacterized protein
MMERGPGLFRAILLGGIVCAVALAAFDAAGSRAVAPRPIGPTAGATRSANVARIPISAPGSWIAIGPVNIGGRVTSLAVDPRDPGRIWLGSAAGGVFFSSDGGLTWTPLFDDQPALAIGAIAAHPLDSNVVYVGTGEDNGAGFIFDGDGVFRTTDGGRTWQPLGLAEVRRIGRIAIDPARPERLFVAAGGDWYGNDAHRGVYRSLDGGATWEKVLYVADDSGGIDVAIDPRNTDRIYAAIWQRRSLASTWYVAGPQSGVYRSSDGGATWSRLANGLPSGPDVGRIGLAVATSRPDTIYALVLSGGGGLFGVYRSDDAGDSWAAVNTSLELGGFSYYFGNIRVDPSDSETVYVLDWHLFRSRDGGASFSEIARSVHVDWHDLVIVGQTLLAGNDAGFFRSDNGGSGWKHAETLPITQIYDLGIDRLQPGRRFAGSQDNGTLRTETGGSSDWQVVLRGDGLQCEVDHGDPNLVYAERQYGQIFRSTNGGNSFSWAAEGIDLTERRNWNMPIALDPSVPGTVYLGAQRVYRSTDAALVWQPISPDLTNSTAANAGAGRDGGLEEDRPDHFVSLVRGTVTVVAVSPVHSGIVWAGTDDGNVWVTEDGGSSWRRANPPGSTYWVTDIAGDPFAAHAAWVSATGFRQGDRRPYLRVTTDLGANWRELGGGLPTFPVHSVEADAEWRGRLFAGTERGVLMSDDGGATWSSLGEGMPRAVVLDLVLHAPSRTLYAGTHGRSIYAFDLGQLPPADGDGDGVDNNRDCALADPGAFSPPEELNPLTVESEPAGGAALHWPDLSAAAGPGTVYDVAAGDLAALAVAGTGEARALACGLPLTAASDPTPPSLGSGFFYLVRGRNACGAGSWGTDSTGRDRGVPACP